MCPSVDHVHQDRAVLAEVPFDSFVGAGEFRDKLHFESSNLMCFSKTGRYLPIHEIPDDMPYRCVHLGNIHDCTVVFTLRRIADVEVQRGSGERCDLNLSSDVTLIRTVGNVYCSVHFPFFFVSHRQTFCAISKSITKLCVLLSGILSRGGPARDFVNLSDQLATDNRSPQFVGRSTRRVPHFVL